MVDIATLLAIDQAKAVLFLVVQNGALKIRAMEVDDMENMSRLLLVSSRVLAAVHDSEHGSKELPLLHILSF